MSQYILESNSFVPITETAGTLVNISNVPAEISLSQKFKTGIILFPRQHFPFAKAVYAARAPGCYGRAIVAVIGTGVLQSEFFTQEDIDAVFEDDVFFTAKDRENVFDDNFFIDDAFFDEFDIAETFKNDSVISDSEDLDFVFDD